MAEIAEQIVQQRLTEIIPEIQRAATEQAYNNLLEALSFDITSAVNIGFENGESIFKDKKTQKMVADSLMREIRKRLNGFKIWIYNKAAVLKQNRRIMLYSL